MERLNEIIKSLDKKPISKYKQLYGRYIKNDMEFYIKNIYGSNIKYCTVELAVFKEKLLGKYVYKKEDYVSVCSYILRDFSVLTYMMNEKMNLTESNIQKGYFLAYKYSQKVLPTTIVRAEEDKIIIRFDIKLPSAKTPSQGKTIIMDKKSIFNEMENRKKGIISKHSLQILFMKNMIKLADEFVLNFNSESLYEAVQLYKDQQYIREYLEKNNYVSFIGNGSILTRKGKTDYKNSKNVIPFKSPKTMEINIKLPSGKNIAGMGIPEGITIITGDAYHGKSTILNGIKNGIYNHYKDDGREYVITRQDAMQICAEDGRSIKNVDISFFIPKAPVDKINPLCFYTDCASGSTSQAASVFEAIEAKCRLMIFDEDRSANNFMYKDDKIRKIIKNQTTRPYMDNAYMFYKNFGISTVMVVGAFGECLKIADKVIIIDKFKAEEYKECFNQRQNNSYFLYNKKRFLKTDLLLENIKNRNIIIDKDIIKIGNECIYVSDIIPCATKGQISFVGAFLYYICTFGDFRKNFYEEIKRIYEKIDKNIFILQQETKIGFSNLEYVRKEDMIALINRLRSIDFK